MTDETGTVLDHDHAPDPLTQWIEQTGRRYEQLLDRIDRAYLNAETCAKAADERMRDATAGALGETFIPSEQLPNVHLEAMQTYGNIAGALLSSVRELQLSSALDVPIPLGS